MFHRRANAKDTGAELAGADGKGKDSGSGTHNVGETTGMFRFRTAENIQVEMEEEVDRDQLPELLRRFLGNHSKP